MATGGHFRLKAIKHLGFKKAPVVFLNLPNLKKKRELNLRLNRNQGEWDLDLLKEFDMDLLLDVGFDDSDLDKIYTIQLSIFSQYLLPLALFRLMNKRANTKGNGNEQQACGIAVEVFLS